MTLGELKASFKRFGGDFDDIQVVLHVLDNNDKRVYDLCTFTGHLDDFSAVIIGGWSVAKQLSREGKLSPERTEEIERLRKEEEDIKKQKDNENE